MNQKAKTIYDFKKGELLTRLKPMVDEDGFKDYSLVGSKLTFVGIANACIYLSKKADLFTKMLLGQDIAQVKLPLELCEEGWANYVEPDFIEDAGIEEFTDKQAINEEIKKAIKREDYLKAEALKQKLDEIIKKEKDGNK